MPRAKDNRKPVGTELCAKCGHEAGFYQVQRGRYLGWLYRKGCDCPADQNRLPFRQLEWLERMQRTPHPMIQHPLQGERVAEPPPETPVDDKGEAGESKTPEPRTPQGVPPKKESTKTGLIGIALLVGSVAVAVMS